MRPRLLALLVAAVTALGLAVVVTPVASADQFGGCNSTSGCLPDNFQHTYCWDDTSYGSSISLAVTYAMENLDSESKYYDTYLGGKSSCTSSTDVRFQSTTAFSSRGDYLCLAMNSADECERARVRLNPSKLSNNLNRKKTACHEIGHSGGLAHDPYVNDCMISGAVSSGHKTYNLHHEAHLNNRS